MATEVLVSMQNLEKPNHVMTMILDRLQQTTLANYVDKPRYASHGLK